MPPPISAPPDAPPAFDWDRWYGSIGERGPRRPEVGRLMRLIHEEQYPRLQGPVAPERARFDSPGDAAERIKAHARELGADMVGICRLEPTDLYRGRVATETHAIALGRAMRYRAFQTVPSPDSSLECMRIYHELGEICIGLGEHIRSLGWPCRVEHPIGDSDVLHVPIALKAGLGELGRHGSIIHPELGPLFRMGSVLTSLPMTTDRPVDAGIAAFCDSCRACRIFCPADAIPDQRSPGAAKDPLGRERYLVDTGKCFSHFAKYHHCSACLPVCVYNHKSWARDRDGGPIPRFPEVLFDDPAPPADEVPTELRHDYPRLSRDGFVPEWKIRARRHAQRRDRESA